MLESGPPPPFTDPLVGVPETRTRHIEQNWTVVDDDTRMEIEEAFEGSTVEGLCPADFLVAKGMTEKQFRLRRELIKRAVDQMYEEDDIEEVLDTENMIMDAGSLGMFPMTIIFVGKGTSNDRYEDLRDKLITTANEIMIRVEEPLLPLFKPTRFLGEQLPPGFAPA